MFMAKTVPRCSGLIKKCLLRCVLDVVDCGLEVSTPVLLRSLADFLISVLFLTSVNVFKREAHRIARAGKILQVLKNCVQQIRL